MDDDIFEESETEKEAKVILNDPNPLDRICEHLDNIIAGEEDNKKSIFLLLLSGKKWIPAKRKQMILLKGEAGAGKTTLMEIASLFNTKTVGRFSKHALDYTNLAGYEVLRLKEIGFMDKEEQGVSAIKFLSADDMGYEVEVTERVEGSWTTKQYKIPPITLITSTTRIEMDSQYERRSWIFNPDESPEQTEKIRKWKVKQERQEIEVELGKREMTDCKRSKQVLRALVRRLKPCTVVIPYIETLLSVLDSDVLRVRGDYDKILSAVWIYGVLLQKVERHKVLNTPKGEVLVVVPKAKRAIEVLKIIKNPLSAMQSGLEARTQKLIEPLKNRDITDKGMMINKFERERIATELGKAEPTVRHYLYEWVKRGYVSSNGKRPATYTLLLNLAEIEKKMRTIVGFEDIPNLEAKMQEEANKYFKTYRTTEGEG